MTNLKTILEQHSLWLTSNGKEGKRAELERTNLQWANLEGADLQRADLRDANLQGANLRDTNLQGANLRGVNLQGANLRGANLEGADLQRANLQWTNLEGADLQGSDLRFTNLKVADLHGANLCGANIDFSAWPICCGSLGVEIDKRIAAQLAYHFCNIKCEDEEVIAAQKSILSLANQFHRVGECGKVGWYSEKIEEKK